jgi:hypothetical protein
LRRALATTLYRLHSDVTSILLSPLEFVSIRATQQHSGQGHED